jgi:hypothetical protein
MKKLWAKQEDVGNVWHAEHEGDPYFLVVLVPDRAWRVTRQVDMSSTYRDHTVNRRRSGQMWCDCEGFRRGGKCRHVIMVNDFLKENTGGT